jgi:hypothetical protein
MSNQSRIAFDMGRVVTLAALLDEDKDIPAASNLTAILDSLTDLSPSDSLDVGMAYLRRVHFFVYYSGKEFEDESELLAKSSSILSRSAPRPPAPETKDHESVKDDDKSDEEKEGGDAVEDKKKEEEEDDENDKATGEDVTKAMPSSGDVYVGQTNPSVTAADQRVSEFILALTMRLEARRSREEGRAEADGVRTEDEKDAEVIAAAQGEVLLLHC